MPTATTIRGGGYRAEKRADGWAVLGVPIFANCKRTLRTPAGEDVTLEVDRAWQEAAVEKAQAKFRGGAGYLAPLYVTHDAGKRRRVGFILPQRVESRPVGDGVSDATIADYIGLSDADYADFKAGKFPYVSAEVPVRKQRDPVIDAAALLVERPFHEFPIQTVGSEVSDPAHGEGVIAFHALNDTASVLMRFSMADDPNAKPVTTDPAAKPDDSGDTKSMLSQVLTLLKQLVTAPGVADPAPKPAPVAAAAFGANGGTTTTGSSPDAATLATFQAELATLKSENDALKTENEQRKAAEAKRAAVAGAVERLKGFDVGTDPVALCTAKFDAGGKVALDAFVDGRILAGDREPDAAWAAGDRKGDVDPLVAKFGAENADMIATLSHEFDTNVHESVKRGGLSREAHVRAGLVRAGRITPQAAYAPASK